MACRKNGKACDDDKKNGDCCSGTCRKGKCRATPGAAGCTVRQDSCKEGQLPCPNNPSGFCVVLDNGKPFCAAEAGCADCGSDDRCAVLSGGIPGKCIKTCPLCVDTTNRACVYKVPVSPP